MTLSTLIFFLLGFATLILGAELLVRGASRLARSMGISSLVVGLTVVAFGTSAPELAVSILSSWSGQAGIAVGNVVGSNIANILLILGVSALAAPLVVSPQIIKRELPILIGVTLAAWLMSVNGVISRIEGIALFAGVMFYTVNAIYRSRRDGQEKSSSEGDEEPLPKAHPAMNLLLIAGGLGLLGLGSHWLIDSAVSMARYFGVSDLMIGLTIVAIGTSLPELATSVMASLRGERDMAVGNIVGSNLFNLMAVLGLTATVAPGGIPVAQEALAFDIPIMAAVTFACIPVFCSSRRINRFEGGLFFGYYLLYLIFMILDTLRHPILPSFSSALIWVAIPLSVAALVIPLLRPGREAA